MLHMTVTYGGSSDTQSGAVTLKFRAPYSEAGVFSRLILYTKTQCYLNAEWESADKDGNLIIKKEQIAVTVYAGKSEDEDGEAILKFKTDVNSIDADNLNQLKRDCVQGVTGEGRTFQLEIMTADDIAQQITNP